MELDGLLKKRKILPGAASTVIWSSSISMCYYNLTALIVPLRLCSSRRPKKKKKKSLSNAVPAANYCSAQSEHIPLCWLLLLLFLLGAAVSEQLHTSSGPVAVGSFLSQTKYVGLHTWKYLICAYLQNKTLKCHTKFSLWSFILKTHFHSTCTCWMISCTKVNPHPLFKGLLPNSTTLLLICVYGKKTHMVYKTSTHAFI